MQLQALTKDDLGSVAILHRKALPDDFCSLLGTRFLRDMLYPEIIQSEGGFGLGVKDGDELRGYIVFTRDERLLRRLVSKHPLFFFFTLVTRLLDVVFLSYVITVIKLLFVRNDFTGSELAYIAVEERYRGMGIGKQLVLEGLKSLERLDCHRCWVKTLSSISENVRFYERLGFRIFFHRRGRVYLEIDLPRGA